MLLFILARGLGPCSLNRFIGPTILRKSVAR